MKLEYSWKILKKEIPPISDFIKLHPLHTALFHADRRKDWEADRHGEAKRRLNRNLKQNNIMGCKSLNTGMRETMFVYFIVSGFLLCFLLIPLHQLKQTRMWKRKVISWWLSELTYRKELRAGTARRYQLVTKARSWWLSLCIITLIIMPRRLAGKGRRSLTP